MEIRILMRCTVCALEPECTSMEAERVQRVSACVDACAYARMYASTCVDAGM